MKRLESSSPDKKNMDLMWEFSSIDCYIIKVTNIK